MPAIDLIDETFVVAAPAAVAAEIADRERWRHWWPDLELTVFQDRGPQGIRWSIAGALSGSMEVWLEPWGDGVIVHHYLRADPVGEVPTRRQAIALTRGRALRAKQIFWAMKDRLEGDRRPGEPPRAPAAGAP